MNVQIDVLDWINHIPCRCMSIAELGERDTGCKRCQARAAVAALIAERDALAQYVERLRRDCAEAYQVVGAGMLGEPCSYAQGDVGRALDNLSAAANGEPRPHDDLLPWPSAFVIRRPTGESA